MKQVWKSFSRLIHDAGANDDDNDDSVLVVLTLSRVNVCCSLSRSLNKVKYKLSNNRKNTPY